MSNKSQCLYNILHCEHPSYFANNSDNNRPVFIIIGIYIPEDICNHVVMFPSHLNSTRLHYLVNNP